MPFNHPDYAGVCAGVKRDMHPAPAQHPDTVAVNRFAGEMAAKMEQARAKGRGGWETCQPEVLSRMLREHVEKGDPRDVANFCMMLWHLGQPIAPAPSAPAPAAVAVPDEVIQRTARVDDLLDELESEVRCKTYNGWVRRREPEKIRLDIRCEVEAIAALAATPPAQMGDSPVSNVETTAPQAQDVQRDADDCFELWWADHMPNATQVEAHTAWTERRAASAAQKGGEA